jgi:isopentenyldiphosphate isomerase
VWNGFLEWLSDSILGCHSYVLKLVPNEQEDELRLLDIENKRLDIASRLKNEFGMEIELYRDSRGLLAFRYKRVDKGGAKNGKVDEYIRGLEAKVNEMGDIDESKLQ